MITPIAPPLPAPPFYFPLRHGRYDVAPGLSKFGKDLGAGTADAHVFQIDNTFGRFHDAKLASRAEDLGKYVCAFDLSEATASDVASFIARRLVSEHPHHFALHEAGDGADLRCALTGDVIAVGPEAVHLTLDALACQVQEDVAIVNTAPDGRHWLSYLHICFPNGWAPSAKIGRCFAAIHEPVAGMAEMNRRGGEFVAAMVRATQGLVRFAWGVTFDDRLNHHPDQPPTPFDPDRPSGFLRVERQTMWGFRERAAALFTIRTYLYDLSDLRRDPATREPLISALRTMPPESLAYKGLQPHARDVIRWLEHARREEA